MKRRELVTVRQAATRAKVCVRTIWNWLAAGKLDTEHTIQGRTRIYADSLFQPRPSLRDQHQHLTLIARALGMTVEQLIYLGAADAERRQPRSVRGLRATQAGGNFTAPMASGVSNVSLREPSERPREDCTGPIPSCKGSL